MARVLVVTTRETDPGRDVRDLAQLSMRFLLGALDAQGKCRNRMDRHGTWEDFPALDDCWGRSIWGLGTAACRSDDQLIHQLSTEGLRRALTQRSPWPRAMAFAALGAADVLTAEPENKPAHDLLSDAADGMTGPGHQPELALARSAPHLRKRGSHRSHDRGGLSPRSPSSCCGAGWSCWIGCWLVKLETDISRSPPWEEAAPRTEGPDSTNNP